jgi:hypothetical protein
MGMGFALAGIPARARGGNTTPRGWLVVGCTHQARLAVVTLHWRFRRARPAPALARSRATADMAAGARGWVDRVAFPYDDDEEVQTTCDVRIWPNHPRQPKPRGHRRTIGCAASVDGEGAATVDRTHHRTSGPHPARSQNSQANTPSGLRRRS